MKRRQWLVGAGAAAGAGLGRADRLDAQAKATEYYELRTYHIRIGEQKTALDAFLREAAVPAWNRQGIRPVGVFETTGGPEMPKVHPNFVYMLTFADQAAKQKAWHTFVADPAWEKLKNTPGYSDREILSNLASRTLRPTSFSQI